MYHVQKLFNLALKTTASFIICIPTVDVSFITLLMVKFLTWGSFVHVHKFADLFFENFAFQRKLFHIIAAEECCMYECCILWKSSFIE